MAAFTQQTFLGASIRYFSSTVGWGNQPSTLEVGLVEDPVNGDSFNPPGVGSPVYFNYSGWKFGGLLQGWNKQFGEGGNAVYTVQVQDPRQLLEGVQLILNDYSGTTYNIPNLYNVYGYLETLYGFGGSFVNDTGMPWRLVRDAFNSLQITTPLRLGNDTFRFFPFSGLDLLPTYYRVGGGADSISVLDFVDEICSVICCDYFVELSYHEIWGNLLNLHFVSRRVPARIGAIEEFVNEVEGAKSKSQGYEFANLTTSKFVVGGKALTMYYQEQAYTENNEGVDVPIYYDDTIAPYWGYDAFDNLIIGNGNFHISPSGTGAEYQFHIDGRPIYIQTGIPATINYKTDLAEMRYAREGQDSWEAFLWFKNDDENSIHFGKAQLFGIKEGFNKGFLALLNVARTEGDPIIDQIIAKRAAALSDLRPEKIEQFDDFNRKTTESKITTIYSCIAHYANEYYGKKFMVRIPFVVGKIEPETNNIVFSVDPVQDGYVAESYWGNAAYAGYSPFNLEKFTNQENLITCYVRFANMQEFDVETGDNIQCKYNLNALSPEDYILDQYPDLSAGNMRENLFVRADVEPKLVFLDKRTLFSPRVVITLASPISNSEEGDWLLYNGLMDEAKAFLEGGACSADGIKRLMEYFPTRQFGGEVGWFSKSSSFYIPDLAVLPLQSNILRYGPWYATADPGKVEFSTQDDLVPWNYGGYNIMNLTGLSMVQDALAAQPSQENGTVEFPGVPNVQIGHALMSSGPAVTDVSTNVGPDGVTTTYRMNTWSWQFGRMSKYNIDRYKRLANMQKEQRKAFRMFIGYSKPVRLSGLQVVAMKRSRRHGNASSPNLMAGDIIVTGSGDTLAVRTNIAAIAGYRGLSQIDQQTYINKAAISLDGLFVPYTTNPNNANHMPHFETPTTDAASPTVDDLNPFGDGGISVAFPDTDTPSNSISNEYDNYDGYVKGVGIKAPVIVGGWGRDVDDNPVPSGGDGAYIDNYKNRADLWKVGPLDIRWDYERKLWTLGGSSFYIGTLNADLENGDVGQATQCNEYWQSLNREFSVYNPHDINMPSGLKVRWSKYRGCSQYIVEPWEYGDC
jgi:hypothetical protein